MLDTIKKELSAKIIVCIFVFFSLWWGYLQITGGTDIPNQIFGAAYGVLALVGALYGFSIAQKWGGMKSMMGKSITMFSLGLLAQEFGQIVYSVYTFFLHVDIPYPSLGDLGYFGSIPLYILGVYYLARVSGMNVSLRAAGAKLTALLIPIVLLVLSYMLFLRDYPLSETPPLTLFLDFGYPFGQAIYVSIALMAYVLCKKILGGVMRNKILFILFALVVQYFSDFTFLYLSRYAEIGPGGINDFMYLLSYFLMALALIQLKTTFDSLKSK